MSTWCRSSYPGFLDTASRCNIPKVLWKHSRESRRWGLSFGLGFLVCKPNPKHGNQPMFGVMRQKKWNINNQCCFTSKTTNNTNAYLYVLWGMPSSKKQNYTQKQMFVITFCKTIPLTYREIDTRLKATPTYQDLPFPHIWHNQFWFLYVNHVVFEHFGV